MVKRITLLLLAVVGAFLFGRALLAEDNNLSVTAPTELTDGSPLEDLAAINFYHQRNGGEWVFLARVDATEPGATVTYLHADQSDGEHCYYATAVRVGGQESEPSNQACKTIDTLMPSRPTGLTVQ